MPSTTTSNSSPSRSGIRTDATTGASYIPSSVRSDGSTRKEIRVRPGYKPPEDVEVYKNRTAEAFKNRGRGGVPGAETANVTAGTDSPTKSKNAKRREAARQKAAAEGNAAEWNRFAENGGSDAGVPQEHTTQQTNGAGKQQPPPLDEEAEKEKKARNLKKKLRQARELQGKKEQGESLLPEQFAKVLKIQELIRDLEKLGFDAEGEKRDTPTEDLKATEGG